MPPTLGRWVETPRTFTAKNARGEWPSSANDLPLMLTQHQLAHLRGVTVRTLQNERRQGRSIPFFKDGKNVLYARADVLAHYLTQAEATSSATAGA